MHQLELLQRLEVFRIENSVTSKGSLALIVFLSRAVQNKEFPLTSDMFLAGNKGQVSGTSMASVQAVLSDYGLQRTLAKEGGRTSRGSIGLMVKYVELLNELYAGAQLDLKMTEAWWGGAREGFFRIAAVHPA